MYEVKVLSDKSRVLCAQGQSLLECLRHGHIHLEAPCGGIGTCRKCKVKIVEGQVKTLTGNQLFGSGDSVLACMVTPVSNVSLKWLENRMQGMQSDVAETETSTLGSINGPLGLSVDIGTTGISVALIQLLTKSIINQTSVVNPQVEFGGDVMTRAGYANKGEDELKILQKCCPKRHQ